MRYYEVSIKKDPNGFNMWRASTEKPDLENVFSDIQELLWETSLPGLGWEIFKLIDDNRSYMIENGIEDIRGRIYYQPEHVYAYISPLDNEVYYFGVRELMEIEK